MSKQKTWLERRAYRRLKRKEWRQERMQDEFIERSIILGVLFVAVVIFTNLYPYFVGQP